MAQKKITDLQLIDEVTGSINFPVDDTIQTYRATPAQMKNYMYAAAQAKEIITNQTEDTTPDPINDLVLTYDNSGTTVKKAKLFRTVKDVQQILNLTGLNNSGTPNSIYDLNCDVVRLRDSNYNCLVKAGSSLSNNTGTSGPAANGRDASGAFANSSWVYFYFIYNPSTDTLASISSANAPSTGPAALPSGYTHWAFATAIYKNSSGNLQSSSTRGNKVYYNLLNQIGGNLTSTSEASLTMTAHIPTIALDFDLNLYATGDEDGAGQWDVTFEVRVVTGNNFALGSNGMRETNSYNPRMSAWFTAPNTGLLAYRWVLTAASTASGQLYCTAYRLPNGAT